MKVLILSAELGAIAPTLRCDTSKKIIYLIMKELTGTFNVRGLTKDTKNDQLASDIDKYKIDICCLQECKITA